MDTEVLEALENEIIRLMELLRDMDPGSEEYAATEATLRDLASKANEGRKVDYDYDLRAKQNFNEHELEVRKFETETELKREELELKKQELELNAENEAKKRRGNFISDMVGHAVEGLGIGLPLYAYSKWLLQGYHFEAKGNIIGSPTFRNVIRFLRPKK